MRNLSAVLLVTTLVGAGGTLPLRAQTPPVPATPAPPTPAPPAPPAAAAPPASADAAKPEAMAEEARRKSEAADRAALLEAHLAALHAGLTLSPEQEKLWPALDQAMRGFVAMREGMRMRWMEGRRAHDGPGGRGPDKDPVAVFKDFSTHLLERAQALKSLSDVIVPLYATLSDEQKGRLPILLRDIGPRPNAVEWLADRLDREHDHDGSSRGDRRWGGGERREWDRGDGDRRDRTHRGWDDRSARDQHDDRHDWGGDGSIYRRGHADEASRYGDERQDHDGDRRRGPPPPQEGDGPDSAD